MFEQHLPGDGHTRATKGVVSQPYITPIHRRPADEQIDNMMKSWRRRERLDRHPLLAVHLLCKQEEKRIYWQVAQTHLTDRAGAHPGVRSHACSYTPHDFQLDDALSQFTCALTDDYSLDSLLLHGQTRGWAMDSSWRNKNENRAAVTFLITVNEANHAVPG